MPGCGHPLPNGADRPFQRGLLRLRGTGQTYQEQGIHQRHHPPAPLQARQELAQYPAGDCDQQTESSDVDIYYEGEAQGLFSLSHLKNELEELLGSPVDIIRLRDRMNQLLRKRIEREGIYV